MSLRRALAPAALLLGFIALFAGLMVFAFVLPSDPIERNVRRSLVQLKAEGHDFIPYMGLRQLQADNQTDALILNQALDPSGRGPLDAAIGNYMTVVPGSWDAKDPSVGQIDNLDLALVPDTTREIRSYSRYWNGHQAVVRPLLLFLDLRAIRYLNLVAVVVLITSVVATVWMRLGGRAATALLLALGASGVPAIPMSIAYVGAWMVALVGMLMVARYAASGGRAERAPLLFVGLGAVTAFVDLLSTPLVSLGLPLAVLLIAEIELGTNFDWQGGVRHLAASAAGWALGFGGTWASKWLLSTLVRGEQAVTDVGALMAFHLSEHAGSSAFEGLVNAIGRNVAMLLPLFGLAQTSGPNWVAITVVCVCLVAAAGTAIAWVVRNRRRDGKWRRVLVLMPLVVLPYAWYAVMTWHSSGHYYFAYRTQAIAVFAATYMLLYAVDPGRLDGLRQRIESVLNPKAAR